MDAFRVSTNGERDGSTPRNHPTAVSPSQSQMQSSSSHRVPSEFSLGGGDLQTLESSFGKLSVFDSSVRLTNRSLPLENQGISDGGYWFPPNAHREIAESQHELQRLPFPNGSFGYDGQNSSNQNGGYNGDLRDVPYLSRNRVFDQRPWVPSNGFGSTGINYPWMSSNNHAVENGRGSVVSLAKDRVSCPQLQKMIVEGSKETIDKIFNDVIFHISDLMVDPYGHHVIQKLIEQCSSQQITQILDLITHPQFQFVRICIDPLGTRTIQSLLKCLHSEDQILRIVETISRVALTLTRSNNAKHVILQCFNQFTPAQNRNLVEVVVGNCPQIATDQHGCCMLQQCLGINCDQLKPRLIAAIIANALTLCVDCYGNYVVQYVVELQDPRVTIELVRNLLGNYGYLSRNKYGSHAVQKLLKINYIDSRVIVLDLLNEIDTLLLDPFGNYVIQTAWFVSKEELRQMLWWHINNNIQLMSCNKFGRKVLEKLNLQSQIR